MHSPLKIVVVEDHDDLRSVVVEVLSQEGHEVLGVDSAEALGESGGGDAVDIFLIDLNLPGEDGFSLCRRLREVQPLVGIIMMTARKELSDRLAGYASGADIYLPKPIDIDELKVVLQALGRRLQESRKREGSLAVSDFMLDMLGLRVIGPKAEVLVSAQEAALLAAFCRATGRQLKTWQLIELLGEDPDTYVKSALEVRLGRLRRKLQQAGATDRCLRALRGTGYYLDMAIKIL